MPRFTVVLLVALAGAHVGGGAASAGNPGNPGDRRSSRRPVVELSVVANEASATRLRDVLLDQLGTAGVAVEWRRRERFQSSDILAPSAAVPAAGPDEAIVASVWIDLSTAAEARLYLKDIRAERFVVRRLLLPRGLDEIAREEIGHIVRSATLGVLTGNPPALTREQARAALEAPPPAEPLPSSNGPPARGAPPPPPLEARAAAQPAPRRAETAPAAAPTSARRLALEIGASWSVQPFAHGIWWTHEAAIMATVRPGGGRWGVWLEAGRRLPVDFHDDAIGVEIEASSLRLGVTVEPRSGGRLALRLGAGAGVGRIAFQPRAGTAAPVALAPRDSFLVPSARVFVGGVFRLVAHVVFTVGLLCDLEAADVHYDIEDGAAGGGVRRALTPFRLRPGLSLGAAWRS